VYYRWSREVVNKRVYPYLFLGGNMGITETSFYSQYSISILADRQNKSESLKQYLLKLGFRVSYFLKPEIAFRHAVEKKPEILIMNLSSEEGLDAITFCKDLYDKKPALNTKVLVKSKNNSKHSILDAIESGASDYIIEPLENDNVLSRIKFHLRQIKIVDSEDIKANFHNDHIDIIAESVNLLSQGKAPHETLFGMTQLVSKIIKAKRCNIIAGSGFNEEATVAAASDDENFENFQLDLEKYPEVRQVLTNGKASIIENIEADPIMKNVKAEFRNIDFNSMLVAPIQYKGEVIGVLSIRSEEETKTFSTAEIKICQLLATTAAIPLLRWAVLKKPFKDRK
jgi:DNA-binding response OmpR family regulator